MRPHTVSVPFHHGMLDDSSLTLAAPERLAARCPFSEREHICYLICAPSLRFVSDQQLRRPGRIGYNGWQAGQITACSSLLRVAEHDEEH